MICECLKLYREVYVTGFGKRNLIAQIMIFLYRRFSATTPKNNSRDKTFCVLSQRYLPLLAYTHAKFERVEVFLKGQARCLKTATKKFFFTIRSQWYGDRWGQKSWLKKNGSTFKVQTLHLSLLVIVQFLYGIIAVTEGGDRVRLDLLT